MMKRDRRVLAVAGFLGLLFVAILAWAETAQVDLVTYYPATVNIWDPFHVRRLTVGAAYMNVLNPLANSAIISGPVGIGTTNPGATGLPLEIAPQGANNAAVKWWGTAGNRYFYIENNLGNLQIVPDDGSANPPSRFFLTNAGRLGVGTSAAPAAGSSVMEIGTLGSTVNAALQWTGQTGFSAFAIENNQGDFRWGPVGAAGYAGGGFTPRVYMTNAGRLGINTAAAPTSPLEIGTDSAGSFATIRWLGRLVNPANPAGAHYGSYYIRNSGGALSLSTGNGATPETMTLRLRIINQGADVGLVGIGALPVSGIAFRVGKGAAEAAAVRADTLCDGRMAVGTPLNGRDPGVFPRAALHVVDSSNSHSSSGAYLRVRTTGGAEYSMNATGTILLIGAPLVPKYLEIKGGQVGFHADPTMDGESPPQPTNVSMVVNGATYYRDGALIGPSPVTFPAGVMLYVNGDLKASSYSGGSSIGWKTDLQRLTPAEEQAVLKDLLEAGLYRYSLKQAKNGAAEQLGVLIEEAPAEMTDDQHRVIANHDSMAAIVAAVKAQQAEIESLRADIRQL